MKNGRLAIIVLSMTLMIGDTTLVHAESTVSSIDSSKSTGEEAFFIPLGVTVLVGIALIILGIVLKTMKSKDEASSSIDMNITKKEFKELIKDKDKPIKITKLTEIVSSQLNKNVTKEEAIVEVFKNPTIAEYITGRIFEETGTYINSSDIIKALKNYDTKELAKMGQVALEVDPSLETSVTTSLKGTSSSIKPKPTESSTAERRTKVGSSNLPDDTSSAGDIIKSGIISPKSPAPTGKPHDIPYGQPITNTDAPVTSGTGDDIITDPTIEPYEASPVIEFF